MHLGSNKSSQTSPGFGALSNVVRYYLQPYVECPRYYRNVERYTRNMLGDGCSELQVATVLALGTVVARDYFRHKTSEGLTCAVGGFVQYGKTSNMICVAAILADHGFTKIIVTSGKTIVLRNQSAERAHEAFKEEPQDYEVSYIDDEEEEEEEPKSESTNQEASDLYPPQSPIFPPPTPPVANQQENPAEEDTDIDPFDEADQLGWEVVTLLQLPEGERHVKTDLGKRALARLQQDYKPGQVYFFVIKKNIQVIKNMQDFLKSTSKDEKIAWFDDEADETVNSKKPTQQRTLLHDSCAGLLSLCRKKGETAYFAYTATLAACLLQAKNSIFYPQAISYMFLSQASYLGLEHFISPEWLQRRSSLAVLVFFLSVGTHPDLSPYTCWSTDSLKSTKIW